VLLETTLGFVAGITAKGEGGERKLVKERIRAVEGGAEARGSRYQREERRGE